MFPVDNETYRKAVENVGIIDVSTATIRQICSLAAELERLADERMIHLYHMPPRLCENILSFRKSPSALSAPSLH